jgi:hypothetical protein
MGRKKCNCDLSQLVLPTSLYRKCTCGNPEVARKTPWFGRTQFEYLCSSGLSWYIINLYGHSYAIVLTHSCNHGECRWLISSSDTENLQVFPSLSWYKKQKRNEDDNETEIYKREIKKGGRKEGYGHTTKK